MLNVMHTCVDVYNLYVYTYPHTGLQSIAIKIW